MAFWSSETLTQTGPQVLAPYDREKVVNSAYELTLGPEGYVTGGDSQSKSRLTEENPDLVIPPGQFALLLTDEVVTIPPDALGLISIKSAFKIHGLVNVSGFHVDPGFCGRLIFSVYNAGGTDVVVTRGDRLFLLWLASLDVRSGDPYRGGRQYQRIIPNRDVMSIGRSQFSPASLNDRVRGLEIRYKTLSDLLIAAAAAVLAGLVLLGASRLIESNGTTSNAPSPIVQTAPGSAPPIAPSDSLSPRTPTVTP